MASDGSPNPELPDGYRLPPGETMADVRRRDLEFLADYRFAKPYLAVNPDLTEQELAAIKTEALAHLLGCLRTAVQLLDETGNDVDARVVEAHAAALARGEEWYGDPIIPPPAIYAPPASSEAE